MDTQGFFPAPALTVYGPAGSGKTFLCDICLQSVLSSPVVSVNCREYSSQRNVCSFSVYIFVTIIYSW